MSDSARSRKKMRCDRCSKKTVHLCYRNVVVCTSCNKPKSFYQKRRK